MEARVRQGETMPQPKRGLGKGLGALIPTAPPTAAPGAGRPDEWDQDASRLGAGYQSADGQGLDGGAAGGAAAEQRLGPVTGAYFDEIPAGLITPNPRQPRQVFDEELLAELAASIKVVGLLQPVVVRKVESGRYEIVMGERRWRACQLAELDFVPAIVRETPDTDLLRDALIENLHREQLNPLEEAAAYQQLLTDFSATHDELARRVGRSRPHISNTIRLLNLPVPVQKRVAAGVLSAGHARALLSVEDTAQQEHLAHRIVAEGLSVRAVEEIVALGASGNQAAPSAHKRLGKAPVAPALKDLADKLSDVFETRVRVELGQRKGKIVVEFASLDDLERIVRSMSPGITRGRGA
jgi:ParB/RepB/Spo0J family partition protein